MKNWLVGGLTAAVLAGGVAAGLDEASAKLNETVIPNPGVLILSRDYDTATRQKRMIGEDLERILRQDGEFDSVKYYLLGYKFEKEGKKWLREELVIRGNRHDKYGSWAVWGVNLDRACRAYLESKSFLGIPFSDYVFTETAFGEVIKSPSFSRTAAEQLTEILGIYAGNNGEVCQSWLDLARQIGGPTGHHK